MKFCTHVHYKEGGKYHMLRQPPRYDEKVKATFCGDCGALLAKVKEAWPILVTYHSPMRRLQIVLHGLWCHRFGVITE